jgi:transcriptional regulator with XRE-family HTH domain
MIGERIRAARKNKLTQAQLAESICVHEMTLRRWEIGQRVPDANKLQKIAKVLNVSVAYLMGETEQSVPIQKLIASDNTANFIGDNTIVAQGASTVNAKEQMMTLELNMADGRTLRLTYPLNTPQEVIERNISAVTGEKRKNADYI